MNANLSKLLLALACFIPAILIYLGIYLKYPLFETMTAAILVSLCSSLWIYILARRACIPWMLAWILPLIIFVPFSNILFWAIYVRRLNAVLGERIGRI